MTTPEDPSPDPSATGVLKKHAPGVAWVPRIIREHFTPSAFFTSLSVLTLAIGYVLNVQHDLSIAQREIHSNQNDVHRLQEKVAREEEARVKIESRLAVLAEVDRQRDIELARLREWRERIEQEAETPIPHATRRRR